ncbi:MAG: tRNA lysidine(34) synthetase TilS [Leptospiraceae bacterium]|nr:tRNA lysidine(34) synthetase TilS [Leptospiraceae bacterium]
MAEMGGLFSAYLDCAARNTGASRKSLRTVQRMLETQLTEGMVVAASGGPDSQLLLHLLLDLSRMEGVPAPRAFHLDHSLRKESSLDAELAVATMQALDISGFLEVQDVEGFARRMRMNLEAAARFLRYRDLFRATRLARARWASTGHHGQDFLETVMMRWIRSSGKKESEILPLTQTMPIWSSLRKSRHMLGDLQIVRPLLFLNRSDIQTLADAWTIQSRQDSSNESPRFLRNRIRSHVQTLMDEGLNPASLWSVHHDWMATCHAVIAEASGQRPDSQQKETFPSGRNSLEGTASLESKAREPEGNGSETLRPAFVRIPPELWQEATIAELGALLQVSFRRLGVDMVGRPVLQELYSKKEEFVPGRWIRISAGQRQIWSAGKELWIYLAGGPLEKMPEFLPISEKATNQRQSLEARPGWLIRWLGQERWYATGQDLSLEPRPAREALYFPLSGGEGTRRGRLKTLFQSESVPPPVRQNLPVLVDEQGWVRRACLGFLGLQDRVYFLA